MACKTKKKAQKGAVIKRGGTTRCSSPGNRRGLRNGTGSRAKAGTCPVANAKKTKTKTKK